MIIFSPGPANISERVRRSLSLPDVSHRGEEFASIIKLLAVCGVEAEYKSVVFTGSGTAAIEAVISSVEGVTNELLVISNGHYGERASRIGEMIGLKVREVRFPATDLPDLETINRKILRAICLCRSP
ncbi:hypothetical protein ACFL42_04540 [Candidatus Omnitrophota bacterium]